MTTVPDDLARLADAYGVATSYRDYRGEHRPVPTEVVRLVLAAMGVVTDTPEQVEGAIEERRGAPWRRLVPATSVVIAGQDLSVALHVPADAVVTAAIVTEEGAQIPLAEPGPEEDRAEVGDLARVRRRVRLPDDLPLGYHRLRVEVDRGVERSAEGLVVCAPARIPTTDRLEPAWGWMLQLYALRSERSWGVGDFGDLREILEWSGAELDADFLVSNPLHAVSPTVPVEPSPYYPSSRLFHNPLYLRVTDLPEHDAAPAAVREEIGRLAEPLRAASRSDRIARDPAWEAKLAALALLYEVDAGRSADFAAFQERRGQPLADFATYCALVERHGVPFWEWPEELHHPDDAGIAAVREELADRIEFHAWLQFCCDEQLAAAQRTAEDAGMSIGVIHDLAVGVDRGGADAWALQDDLALDVSVGAPPDDFNQIGQDWGLPPLRPDRLTETGYAPFRQMIAAVLEHAGGIRIDHILGLFRLWWVPLGHPASEGTYVAYPARDLLAILALEADRAGAVVVGEDLGTVSDEVRGALAGRGVLGSRVLYFERADWDGHRRLAAHEYPPHSLASITTHDLPTAAGWWADEAPRIQSELGLLREGSSLASELERTAREHDDMRELLVSSGAVPPERADDPDALREGMHRFLARCSSLLVAVQPADAVGDLRQPNLPGTTDEYPNWRLPVAAPGPEGPQPQLLEDLRGDERVARIVALLREGRNDVARRRAEGGT
jgi:4-alpha-glucanotransferase